MGHLPRVSAAYRDRRIALIKSLAEFQKVSDSPFTESRAPSASASSDSARAPEDVSCCPTFHDRY